MLQYFLYNTLYGNTVVDRSVNPFAPSPPYAQVQVNFNIPEIQPSYLYRESGGTIIVNTQANIDAYLKATELPPTADGNVTYGEFTGETKSLQNQIDAITGITTNLGLQQVTQIGATTNIESTFNSGIKLHKIRPTGDTVTAIQITKATGTTVVLNVDTINSHISVGTTASEGVVHAYGIDTNPDPIGTEDNAFLIDGPSTVDKDIQWAEEGVAKWLAETYRDENAKFWYLYNVGDNNSPIVVSETGRIGINNQSNIMNYHAALLAGGPNDIIVGGIYDKNYVSVYEIQIDGIGNPNTFKWRASINEGQTFGSWSASSGCTTGATLISDGVTVQFENVTGHTLGTTFIFCAFTQLPIGTFIVATAGFTEVQQTNDYTANPIIYTDVTAEANSSTLGSDVLIFHTGTTVNAIYFGTQVKIDSIYVNMQTLGQSMLLIAEFWDGSTWVDITTVSDNFVDGTKNLTQSGALTWDSVLMTTWIPAYMPDLVESGYELYWVRLRTSTNPTIAPIANSFARGGNYRFAVLTSPSDVKPSMYIDSLGRTNIGGGNMTGCNLFQINESSVLEPSSTASKSLAEIDSQDSCVVDFKIKLSSNDVCGGAFTLFKSRGTLGSPSGVTNGDTLGLIRYRGRVGTLGKELAHICAQYTGDGSSQIADITINLANGGNPTEKVRFAANGTNGFGIINPTAVVHLKAGSTSIAPLKFNSGALLSTPQSGAVEYLGNSFYGTTTGGTRYTFAFLEAPQFTGNVLLPTTTCLGTNNLCSFILNSGGTNNTCVVKTSTFNTYTGNTATAISNRLLTTVFSNYTGTTVPNTYYNKTQINSYTGATNTAIGLKLNTTTFSTYTGTTVPANYYNKTQINSYTGATNTAIGNRLLTTIFSTFTGTTLPANYYNKTQINSYTGATNTAIGNRLLTTIFNTYTGTTAPANYYSKAQINSYTGSTQLILNKSITGATNGICRLDCHNIEFGGPFTHDTQLGACQYNYIVCAKNMTISSHEGTDIYDNVGCNINIFSCGGSVNLRGETTGGTFATRFTLNQNQALFADARAVPHGIEYCQDYSNTYTDRSLVDKAYVLTQASGLKPLSAVNVATTGNISISSAPATIGGVTLTNGMRILVKDQGTGSQNGIYDFHSAGAALTRSSDFSGGTTNWNNTYVSVLTGATNQNTSWILNTPNPITIGVTSLTFVLFSSQSGVAAGNGICVTQGGGNYNIAIKTPTFCGLCVDASGLYVNPNIAGTGLNYTNGVLSVCGSALAGNSICWSANTFNVSTTTGTLSTALGTKLNTSAFNSYSASTLTNINNRLLTTTFNTYTGTTEPATYLKKTTFSTYTGTTVPNTYYSKTQINSYTGATNTAIGNRLLTTIYSNYTGTTVPNTYYNKTQINSYSASTLTNINSRLLTTIYSNYTGTTVPNTYYNKTQINSYTGATSTAIGNKLNTSLFNTYTGTTAPANYYSKAQINSYTGKTQTTLNAKLYLSGGTMTGVLNVCKPAQNDNTSCAASTSWYISQAGTANPLMDGLVCVGTSNLFARQDHVHPRDTNKLSLSGGTMTGTLKGTIFSGSTCVTSPITCGSTCVIAPLVCASTCVTSSVVCGTSCVSSTVVVGTTCVCSPVILGSTSVCSPVITGSTKVCSPIVCGTSCISSPIACGTTCVIGAVNIGSTCSCSPILLGSTCVCSPVVIGSTCSNSPLHCGACVYATSVVCSPIITGSTRVCSPIVCGTSCIASPITCGTTCAISPITIGSTCVCGPVGLFSTSSCSPIHCGACGYFSTAVCSPIITGSTKVCSPTIIATTSLCSAGTAKIVGATTGSTLFLTTTPPAATIQQPTLFYDSTTKQIESKQLTGGTDFYRYTECTTNRTTASGTATKAHGLSATTLAGTYSIDYVAQFGNATANACTFAEFRLDGTAIGCRALARENVAAWNVSASISRDSTLTAALHCFELWYCNSAGTACIPYSAIRLKRIC